MLDPVTTPLLILVLGKIGDEIIGEACKDFLKDKLKSLLEWLGALGRKSDLELAYSAALQDAYAVCLEMLLQNVAASGYLREELKQYEVSLKKFVKDPTVANELLESIKNPLDVTRPSAGMLAMRWKDLGCEQLPGDLWTPVTMAFRRRATKQAFVNEPLREVLNAQNIDQIRELLEREGGVRPEVREDKYVARMRTKYSPVDLANLMPAYAENPGQLVIRDVFVPQFVKENPPLVELPKDLEKLLRDAESPPSDDTQQALFDEELRITTAAYVTQVPKPVLDVIVDERLVVLIGEPGSGKSTLLRYLLLGVLEPPRDATTRRVLSWAAGFVARKSFALMLELRDFNAMRRKNDEVDSFVDYALYLGRTEQYFLDDKWLDDTLQNRPSLILFDGLDEIFDRAERDKVLQEIVGFSQRYPNARIVVTSRPVGYRDTVLRQAGFKHFAIQDLNDAQIATFTRGWFQLTFPQQPDLAAQRVDRVMSSIGRSGSIRLLAGNPMLLTIMVLLAREQELPRERVAFYEAAVNVLCHHWDANRNLGLPDTDYMRLDDKKELLRRIAIRMQTGVGGLAGNAIHEKDLESEAAAWFEERFKQTSFDAILSARKMIEQLHVRNYVLCLRGPSLYGFVHRTFLEYLTASEYVSRFRDSRKIVLNDLAKLFLEHARLEDWREVLRLIAGQINEQFVAQIIERIVPQVTPPAVVENAVTTSTSLLAQDEWFHGWADERGSWDVVTLAIWCLSEVRNVSRIEGVGRLLGEHLLRAGKSNRWVTSSRWQASLMQAVDEVGPRWPGSEYLRERMQSALPSANVFTVGQQLYPRVLIAVANDRADIEWLLSYDKGFFPLSARRYAAEAFVKRWPDAKTRAMLRDYAVNASLSDVRTNALGHLANQWPDTETSELLRARITDDAEPKSRAAAIRYLSTGWANDSTRALLISRATEDPQPDPRSAALEMLAQRWPETATQELLSSRGLTDQSELVRTSAVKLLAKFASDAATQDLLESRALTDESELVRAAAFDALLVVRGEAGIPLFKARLVADPSAAVRGTLAAKLAGLHSRLGTLVFTKDVDGHAPYLDPMLPVPSEHIERARQKAGLTDDDAQSALSWLNAYLGWDITVGAGART